MKVNLQKKLSESLRSKQGSFWLIWIGFVCYAIIASSYLNNTTRNTEIIIAIISGEFNSIDPLVFSVFNLLGILPLMYGLVILFDQQDLPSWPFVLLSFFSGAFAILPYLALRQFNQSIDPTRLNRFQQRIDRRYNDVIVFILTFSLLIYGFGFGSPVGYVRAWQTINLVNIMTIDLLILSFSLPAVLIDDMYCRGFDNKFAKGMIFIPLLGAVMYLMIRPRIMNKSS